MTYDSTKKEATSHMMELAEVESTDECTAKEALAHILKWGNCHDVADAIDYYIKIVWADLETQAHPPIAHPAAK